MGAPPAAAAANLEQQLLPAADKKEDDEEGEGEEEEDDEEDDEEEGALGVGAQGGGAVGAPPAAAGNGLLPGGQPAAGGPTLGFGSWSHIAAPSVNQLEAAKHFVLNRPRNNDYIVEALQLKPSQVLGCRRCRFSPCGCLACIFVGDWAGCPSHRFPTQRGAGPMHCPLCVPGICATAPL